MTSERQAGPLGTNSAQTGKMSVLGPCPHKAALPAVPGRGENSAGISDFASWLVRVYFRKDPPPTPTRVTHTTGNTGTSPKGGCLQHCQ